ILDELAHSVGISHHESVGILGRSGKLLDTKTDQPKQFNVLIQTVNIDGFALNFLFPILSFRSALSGRRHRSSIERASCQSDAFDFRHSFAWVSVVKTESDLVECSRVKSRAILKLLNLCIRHVELCGIALKYARHCFIQRALHLYRCYCVRVGKRPEKARRSSRGGLRAISLRRCINP